MRFSRPLFLAPIIFREALFRISMTEKVLCLSFDDGPSPGSTLPLLRIIENYGMRAVFFCTGMAAAAHPELISRIRDGGHMVGNHGYYHYNGFMTSTKKYVENVKAAAGLTSSGIFRPPFGLITPAQFSILSREYKIVFWDVMAYDFDPGFGKERSLGLLCNKTRAGSVIVLHDSEKSTASGFLGNFIDFAFSEGYRFEIPALLNQEP